LALILALSAACLATDRRRVRQKGLKRLEIPIVVYGTVITLMLLSALLTSTDLTGNLRGRFGQRRGHPFYSSDVVLAWNKFVTPIKNGRLLNMILYHSGQFTLIAGVLLQFMGLETIA